MTHGRVRAEPADGGLALPIYSRHFQEATTSKVVLSHAINAVVCHLQSPPKYLTNQIPP